MCIRYLKIGGGGKGIVSRWELSVTNMGAIYSEKYKLEVTWISESSAFLDQKLI